MKRSLLLAGVVVVSCLAHVFSAPIPRRDGQRIPEERTPRVIVETNFGNIIIELNAERAPTSVKNFLQYVDVGFYDGTIFHRVIPDFMIQGGGLFPDLKEKPAREPIRNEGNNGLLNQRGTIALARMANPDSGTCQFFINTKDNPFLDRPESRYSVFGRVVEGMDVVDKIRFVRTGQQGGHSDVPTEPVIIRSVRRLAR